MDLVTVDKLRAMKRYRKKKIFLSLMQYCLSLLCLGLLLSSPLWLSIACSSLRRFLVVSLPGMLAYHFSPKCLFVLGNAIVVFLVGESRLSAGPAPSAPVDVYEEYMVRRKGLRGGSTAPVRVIGKEDDKERVGTDGLEEEEEDCEEEEQEQQGGEEEEEEKEDLNGEEEALPADELNRRVEDFIARVNWERRIEARMLICNG